MLNVPTLYKPVLETTPKTLRIGPVRLGSLETGRIVITNFDGCHLHIFGIRMSENSDSAFDLPQAQAYPLEVPSEGNTTIEVSFRPVREGCASGRVEIRSDDPVRPLTEVGVFGTGV